MLQNFLKKLFPRKPSELEVAIDQKIPALREQFNKSTMFTKEFADGNPYIQVTFLKDSDNPHDTTNLQRQISEAADGYAVVFHNVYLRDMSYCFPGRKRELLIATDAT